ncbi:MAG: hypothetical protein EXX96DRAFT_564130 [Benjaminiella poitrasii]|nr:MAG: hypothetical protein EXX96DRAFT_564130 [Benjaminiella poitrasii]
MSSSSNVGGNEHKRKRLTQACELCRRKKIKCDGSKPACNNCKRLNNTCTYSSSSKKRGPRQGYIEMLEQRLAKMEQILLSDSGDSSNNIISNLAKSDEINEQHDSGSSTANSINYLAEKLSNNENDSETSSKMKHTTKDLYGETSPTSYSSLSSNYPSPNAHILSQNLPLKQDNDKDSLPPIDVIEHMVDLYFKYLFPSTPIFIEHELRSDIRDRKCPEFLLFSLLAVSARYINIYVYTYVYVLTIGV